MRSDRVNRYAWDIGYVVITRFSSRRQSLDRRFLNDRLRGARRYDRIAGYFSSSILEVAGEALESVAGPVRMVCNSTLNPQDVVVAKQAAQAAMAASGATPGPSGWPKRAGSGFAACTPF